MDTHALNISITSRRSKETPQIIGDKIILQGELDWLIAGPAEHLRAIATNLGRQYCETLSDHLLCLSFGNSVGLFEIPHLGLLEIRSGKWTADNFDNMLVDIMQICCALPFTSGERGALPYERTMELRHDILYHIFVYFRYILSDTAPREDQLIPAVRLILSDPHRRFEPAWSTALIHDAHRLTASSLLRTLTSGHNLQAIIHGPAARLELTRKLGGYLPASIDQSTIQSQADTPENRFVKMFLKFGLDVIDRVEDAVKTDLPSNGLLHSRLNADCRHMRRALLPLTQHSFWEDVGQMRLIPGSSTILQRRAGYRHVFRHHARARLASRIPLDSRTLSDILEVKDIARLYEVWAFFQVVDSLTRVLGKPYKALRSTATKWQTYIPGALAVNWSGGISVHYNASFSRSGAIGNRSYSFPLRPDISIRIEAGGNIPQWHLLDAKFKIDRIPELIDSIVSNSDSGTSTTYQRSDLYKMHTYRDAIAGTRSVWIIYPGGETCFHPIDGPICHFADSLRDITLDGVGAIALIPGNGNAAVLDIVIGKITRLP